MIAAGVLLIAACGSGETAESDDPENVERTGASESSALDHIVVSDGEDQPVVEVSDLEVDEAVYRIVEEGDGETVEAGDQIAVDLLTINGSTGDVLESTFTQDETVTLPMNEQQLPAQIIDALVDRSVGSRVLVALPPGGVFDDDVSILFLFDIVGKVPTEAQGEPQDLPGDVPEFGIEGGVPSGFTAGGGVPDEVDDMRAVVPIEGEGAEVRAGQNITVHYHGQIYPDGEVFDSSWGRGEPTSFGIGVGQVIPCWDEGLVGQTVGSRVILICPADTAYGDRGSGAIQPGDTLIFAVDLLAAS